MTLGVDGALFPEELPLRHDVICLGKGEGTGHGTET